MSGGPRSGRRDGEQSNGVWAPVTPVLLARGFRPFFLLAGLFGLVSMTFWVYAFGGGPGAWSYYGIVGWHSHEMLFGYAVAVLAGFLLTAVHNWTNEPTATGLALAVLALLWLVARLLGFFAQHVDPVLVAVVDFAFLPALAWTLGKPLLGSGQRRNRVFLFVLALMALANLAVHGQRIGLSVSTAALGHHLQLSLIVLLMVLIGGRVIPFFAERAVPGCSPVRRAWVERLAIGSAVAVPIVQQVFPGSTYVAVLAALAACVHGYRLTGWYTPRIWTKPLLWVLYLGYAWIAVGYAFTACAAAGVFTPSAAIHAFTAGAIGALTLGMMTRVTLGHTGRALEPGPVMAWSFALINVSALLRTLLPVLLPAAYPWWLLLAGGSWCVAFALFVIVQGPVLWSPRRDGKPG